VAGVFGVLGVGVVQVGLLDDSDLELDGEDQHGDRGRADRRESSAADAVRDRVPRPAIVPGPVEEQNRRARAP
jgi:hypothetical protein